MNNGKTYSIVIKHRDYPDDTKALISQTIFKIIYNEAMKLYVNEKMEEKGIEVMEKRGIPKKLNSKRNLTEYQRER